MNYARAFSRRAQVEIVLWAVLLGVVILMVIAVKVSSDAKAERADAVTAALDADLFIVNYLQSPVTLAEDGYSSQNIAELISYSYADLGSRGASRYDLLKQATTGIVSKAIPRLGKEKPCWKMTLNQDEIADNDHCSREKLTVMTAVIPGLNTADKQPIHLIFTVY